MMAVVTHTQTNKTGPVVHTFDKRCLEMAEAMTHWSHGWVGDTIVYDSRGVDIAHF